MNTMKLIGLGIAAPFIAGVSFVYYVGYKVTRWAFQHPALAVGTVAAGGMLWYASRQDLGKNIGAFVHTYQDRRAASLEERMHDLQYDAKMRERALQEEKARADDLERRLLRPQTMNEPIRSLEVPDDLPLSVVFKNYEEIIELNKKMGFEYTDVSPHSGGKRTVYYKKIE